MKYGGTYAYFVYNFQPKSITQLIAAAAGIFEFSVFNSKGKCQCAYQAYLKKNFGKCPGLLAEFEPKKNRDKSVERIYLVKLNDYLAAHPEVSTD